MRERRWTFLGLSLFVASIVCGVVAFLQRHSLDTASVEGAYFNRSVGSPPSVSAFSSFAPASGNQFDPFRPGHAYLWLGMGIGFGVAALAVALASRRSPS